MSADAPIDNGSESVYPRSKGWFKPGNVANPNGRPKGARNLLAEDFVQALYEDFKEGGKDAVAKCREEKPDVYLNVIAKVLPKHVNVTADDSVADLASGLHAVAEFLSSFVTEGSSSDHEGAVSNRPVLPLGVRPQAH